MATIKADSIEQLSSLLKTADAIDGFFESYDMAIAPTHVDKYGAGFCDDGRFTLFKTENPVFFSAYTGVYGQSGCSTFGIGINAKLAGEYFCKALQSRDIAEAIFKKMAGLMRDQASKIKGDAEAELTRLRELIDKALEVA